MNKHYKKGVILGTWTVKKQCLSCKFYRLVDMHSGLCRVDKKKDKNYPIKLTEDVCDRWKDCGQQLYIRKGWIKAQQKSGKDQGVN